MPLSRGVGSGFPRLVHMTTGLLDPWALALDEFPLTGTAQQKFRAAIRFAILAPSRHNTQPWLFRFNGDALELLADRTRGLAVVDPDDRELLIGCGASLRLLCLALTHYGEGSRVTLLPDPSNPDLLARVELTESIIPTGRDHALFAAISARRTNRFPFEPDPIPEKVLDRARVEVGREKAWLQILTTDGEKSELAGLAVQGDQQHLADPHFRRELAAWIHSNRSHSRDGMPGFAHGVGDIASEVGPLVIRNFDIGEGVAAYHRELVLGSPVLAIIWTEQDTPLDWLNTGQALIGALLSLQADGIAHSYLNQVIEVPELRQKVRAVYRREHFPQIILRLGLGKLIRPTARRDVDEVLQIS